MEITERQWRRLQEAIRRDQCVLVLGPDAALDPENPSGPSLTAQAAHYIAGELDDPGRVVDDTHLNHVAQIYFTEQRSHTDLENLVDAFYTTRAAHTTDFHRQLAGVPFSLIVQTTHDELFLRALESCGKHPLRSHYDRYKPDQIGVVPTPSSPLLYELFGSITELRSLVLTETDLLDFLAAVLRSAPSLPSYLLSRFSAKETSFLFLGFRFSDWPSRVLLHALRPQTQGERSLAFESERVRQDPHHRLAAVFFDQVHAVEFPDFEIRAFVSHLSERLRGAVQPRAVKIIPQGAPRAFLCYTSEDLERVTHIEQMLHHQGIDTWRDKQSLRGGDNWKQMIPEVIDRQVDYFVVCASKNLQQRRESYCFWKIDYALDRQGRFNQDRRFVIQGLIEPNAELPKVPSDLHHVRLFADSGLADLVSAIREDWGKGQSEERRG